MKKKLTDLQKQYEEGKITKAKYYAQLAQLLEEEEITQDEYDEAEKFDPEANKLIYTQDDVDGMIKKKAIQEVRKILKDAGVEVEAGNKDLTGKVVELVKIGAGKMKAPENTDPEAAKAAATTAARITSLTADLKNTRLENAALKLAGKFNPVSQTAVIALLKSDYAHDIDYLDEETGEIDIKSIEKAYKRMQLSEPTLFKSADDNNNGGRQQQHQFQGKPPGGNGGAAGGSNDQSAKLAEAKALMGIKTQTQK